MPSKPMPSKPRSSSTSSAGNPADTMRGTGGELQQQAGGDHPAMTTAQGIPLADNQNSLRPAPRGPTLLEDFILREKITHFDHERIPERIVHARGSAAHGYFELTESLGKYTTAKILTETGKRTPVFCRFSTVAGGAGSVDTPRDVRGFAVKFYTSEGNWDLVGNNIPVPIDEAQRGLAEGGIPMGPLGASVRPGSLSVRRNSIPGVGSTAGDAYLDGVCLAVIDQWHRGVGLYRAVDYDSHPFGRHPARHRQLGNDDPVMRLPVTVVHREGRPVLR